MIEHPAYPIDGWHIRETDFDPDNLGAAETIFATANGYLGLRGNLEEGAPVVERGTYLNGFYEKRPYVYPESAYGLAAEGQTMLNVSDGKMLQLTIDDEPFDITTGNLIQHTRVLDLRRGFAGREVVWESPSGRRISLRTRRMVSFTRKEVACLQYEVVPLDESRIQIDSLQLANESDRRSSDDPREVSEYWGQVLQGSWTMLDGTRSGMAHHVQRSGLAGCAVADHRVTCHAPVSVEPVKIDDSQLKVSFVVDRLGAGQPLNLEKHLVYTWGAADDEEAIRQRALDLLDQVSEASFEELLGEQVVYLDDFWRDCHIELEGDDAVQQAVRFALFQMLQASACAAGHGIPAKGLTGQGYGGHYFWDMEAYVLQALTYIAPEKAADAIRWRHATLPEARAWAQHLSHRGALFPWRTIDGEEASAFFPAGTAEYHIDADIAEAVQHYVDVSGDDQFLVDHGAELLIETARFWVDLGHVNPARGGAFCIDGVTGPDEYTAMVDNNTFTNLMAKANLENAAAAVDQIRAQHPDAYAGLVEQVGLADDEPDTWREAAAKMYVHHDEVRGLTGQDDSFLDKEPWDFEGTPPEDYPLLLHYHPLDLYRRQVVKQADLVMAILLQGRHFTAEQARRDFDYYDPITTADSSLSKCIQASVAAQVGHVDKAWEYTRSSAVTDLANVQHNVHDGIHIASQAGTWMALVYGFGGLRRRDGGLCLDPKLPAALTKLTFRVRYRSCVLEAAVTADATTYTLLTGDQLTIRHRGEHLALSGGTPVTVT